MGLLGVISIVTGWHRVPFVMTCAFSLRTCKIASKIWRREQIDLAPWTFLMGTIVAFFLQQLADFDPYGSAVPHDF